MLETELGKENFDKTMTAFGKNEGKKLADTSEYFKFIETVTGRDLSTYRSQWLERKQNPVLTVNYKVLTPKKLKGNKTISVHVSQEKPAFHFPLEIEVITEKQNIRRTIQLKSPTEEVTIPIDSRLLSVRFDPNDRLFAIIKDGTSSFLNPRQFLTPIKDGRHQFKSDKNNHIVELEIKTAKNRIDLFKREDGKEIHLELTGDLSPKNFKRDGSKVYSLDTEAGKIHFPNESYDISEPLYPRQFALMLFSLVDWEKTEHASFISLYNSGFGSAVLKAVREQIQENHVIIRIDGLPSSAKMYLSNGIPIKYSIGSGKNKETFTRNGSIVSDATTGD
jgi:hypothetical protein